MFLQSLANQERLFNKNSRYEVSVVFSRFERYGFRTAGERSADITEAPNYPRRSGGKGILKIEGSYTLDAPRERVWQLLLDPEVMAKCMPGCESMKEIAPDQYEAVMKVGVASVKGTYKGKVNIKDKKAPSHYVLSGEGQGGPGFMRGDLSIDLEEREGKTLLRYSTDAQVGGLIAAIGQRMLNGVAKMMVEQFFKKVETFL